jgi:hypothetical protein
MLSKRTLSTKALLAGSIIAPAAFIPAVLAQPAEALYFHGTACCSNSHSGGAYHKLTSNDILSATVVASEHPESVCVKVYVQALGHYVGPRCADVHYSLPLQTFNGANNDLAFCLATTPNNKIHPYIGCVQGY